MVVKFVVFRKVNVFVIAYTHFIFSFVRGLWLFMSTFLILLTNSYQVNSVCVGLFCLILKFKIEIVFFEGHS